ncbi:hypothetical protein [Paenibacillus xylanexedens]|uniref:hypothetical protein n=1 Tax=Paenibacillus xylanexedens TaxID=528191 RepID=UPI0011A0ABE1|nr:hypothetical protein [Paenibacillus xylanexedens]
MTTAKTQETTLKNIKISRKSDTTVGLTLDLASFVNKSLTADDLSSTGKSYLIATSGQKFLPLEMKGFEGASIMVKVLTNRKEYDEAIEAERNKSVAKEALAEMQQAPANDALLAIVAKQNEMMAAMQAQIDALSKPKRTRKAAAPKA